MIQDAKLKPIERDAVRVVLFFFRVLKNFVERASKSVRKPERELKRRRVFARFERDNGLTCDIAELRELLLREISACESPMANLIGDLRGHQARARA